MNKLLKKKDKKGKKGKKTKDSKKQTECTLFGAKEEKTATKKETSAFGNAAEDDNQIAINVSVTENKNKEVVTQESHGWKEDWQDDTVIPIEQKEPEKEKPKVVGWGNQVLEHKQQDQKVNMEEFPAVFEDLDKKKEELQVDNKNTMLQNMNMNTKKTLNEVVNSTGGGFFSNTKKTAGGFGSGGGGLLKLSAGGNDRLNALKKPLPKPTDQTQIVGEGDGGVLSFKNSKPAGTLGGLTRGTHKAKDLSEPVPESTPSEPFGGKPRPTNDFKLERSTAVPTGPQEGDQSSIFGGSRRTGPREPPIVLERGTGKVEPQPVRAGRFGDAPGMITRGGWVNGQKDESDGAVRTFVNSKKKTGTLLDGLKAKPGQSLLTAQKKVEPAPKVENKRLIGGGLERGAGKSFKLGGGESAFGGFDSKKKGGFGGSGAARPKGKGLF